MREQERELRPLSDQYNEFARPAQMWDLCLEMLHFSQYHDADGGVARDLWEKVLVQAAAVAPSPATALAEACHRVRALGQRLFPSEQAFPVAHVALKLELMAAGLWGLPEGVAAEAQGGGYGRADGSGAADPTAVADAMLAACGGSPEAVHAAYDRLLATPVQRAQHDRRLVQEQQLQTPALRLRLLRSALRVLQRWDESISVGLAEVGRCRLTLSSPR